MELERIELDLKVGKKRKTVYFQGCNTKLYPNPESILTASLLPAMKMEIPVTIPEADEKFLNSIDQIQDIFSMWDDQFLKVPVQAVSSLKKIDGNREVGAFFTGGVDSYYTFLKHKDEISHLIFVHGLDIDLNSKKLRQQVSQTLKRIADNFNKKIIEVETNLRWFSDPLVYWGYYHGSALTAVGHLLKKKFHKIYLPSSHTYSDLFPWGSHPLTDPLWSSSNLEFVHDGCEATRVKKTACIAESEMAMNTLRVCWKNYEDVYNCSECEKCVRTMINLKAVDALDRCTVFNADLGLVKVARLRAKNESTRSFIRENIDALHKKRDEQALILALRWVLAKPNLPDQFRHRLREMLFKIGLKKKRLNNT